MIISFRKWVRWLKFMLLFILLTLLLYQLTGWISDWTRPDRRYREPEGRSVKAFQLSDRVAEPRSPMERLRFFYWFGE